MKQILFLILVSLLFSCKFEQTENKTIKKQQIAIVIHGGAGYITSDNLSIKKQKEYSSKLNEALDEAYLILENNGSSLEAIQKAITILEDSPLFNTGKGSVFDASGKNKMDASIMDGKTLNSGAVAGVGNIKNPILLARKVMDSTKHVLLSGRGAEVFAEKQSIPFEKDDYFYTDKAFNSWKSANEKAKNNQRDKAKKYGTVGAVALDKNGNIAAGTSTGGMTYKKYGRIGDSPIIGAGTYANNKTCGVSCTGVGEYFIRTLAAHEISNLIQYKKLSVKEAVKEVIHTQIDSLGGVGGIIVLDKNANIAWDFNTIGMFRAYKKSKKDKQIKMFGLEN